MLYGPPGTGKSYLAKACATECEGTFFSISSSDLVSKWMGESERLIKSLFKLAREKKPSIIFIDEVDSLATSRESGLHEATRRILSTLLRKIDSFESDGEVLVICATNRKKDLDPALLSRTDLSIRFELPDASTRAQIF